MNSDCDWEWYVAHYKSNYPDKYRLVNADDISQLYLVIGYMLGLITDKPLNGIVESVRIELRHK